MSKVTGKIKLIKDPRKGWILVPIDLNNLRQQAIDKWVKGDASQSILLDMTIAWPYESKTGSQLAYIYGVCYPVFYSFYITQGYIVETEEQKEQIRNEVKYAVGFIEQKEPGKFYDKKSYQVKSLAKATKEEVSDFIDKVIRLAAEYSMIIPDPSEYLHKMGLDKFDD